MIRVYTASKLGQHSMWAALQRQWPRVFFHARWLRHVAIGTPDTAEHAERFWIEDQEDVSTADALLIYAERGEHLRGALIEAGIAIASAIPVIVVGEHSDYGTWQYHPTVMRAPTLAVAYEILCGMEDASYAHNH